MPDKESLSPGLQKAAILLMAIGEHEAAEILKHMQPREVQKVGGGRLNLLAVDGRSIAGTTYGERLFVLEKESGTCVASEPYDDDPDWFEVPEGVLVEGNEHGLTLTPLEL